eukprot:IDg8996t1
MKSKLFVRSIIERYIFALSAPLDRALVINHDLDKILRSKIPLLMFTDSNQLLSIISGDSHTIEMRQVLYISLVRETYNNQEITNVGLITGDYNAADGFNNLKSCKPLYKLPVLVLSKLLLK